MRRTALAWIALPLALVACSGKDGTLAPSPLKAFTPTLALVASWDRRVGEGARTQGLRLQPALSGPNIVVAGDAGRVLCLSREDGHRRWRVDTGAEFSAGPAVAYDQVFLGTRKGQLIALSAVDGKELWRAALTSEVLAPPTVGSDMLVVKTLDGKVAALERATGKQRWSWQGPAPTLALRVASQAMLVSDGVLVGTPSGELAALTRDDGQPLWQRRIAESSGKSELDRLVDVASDFQLAGDLLFVATYQGRLVAMDLRNGQFTWQQPGSSYRALAVDHDTVFVVDADSNVLAYRAADGTLLWRQDAMKGRSLTAPVVIGENLLFGDFDGYVHLLRESDGTLLGRTRVGTEPIAADPLVEDGKAWVLDTTGQVTALDVVPWESIPHLPDWAW